MAGPNQSKPSSNPPRLPPQSRPGPLRCICIILLLFIIVIGIAILITWLIIRPTPLDYTIEDAKIHNFNISSNNALNATFNLTIKSYNNNHKVGLWYDSMDITIWYDKQMLAFADVSPFFQRKRNETTLHVDIGAMATPLMTSVAKKIKNDRSSGEVELVVKLNARIRFKVGAIKSKHYEMAVDCSPVVVHFSPATPFDRVHCDVDV
ncbi:uncharacterized protein At1g08160-like [Dioscorea cayenensis subsp. rotundata]|uniref:Uncharacterized protein At1g08160-like n=1 Tax=Dioscorea cayennensis subsp. rotundata TaxID=55577 RepID=A0AB40CFB0_DIOCR|nr:uncharacterized protein At1g08160-like [Dioscorea cayenensis subsp. rotundata]